MIQPVTPAALLVISLIQQMHAKPVLIPAKIVTPPLYNVHPACPTQASPLLNTMKENATINAL
jgi:hypothetical protein